ncbi:fatty-acid amide hydrolase [Holotrichia oblita]|uniref:Fatty-acid amide hydrolase n=1 Tax=Holotrichia oblita TaxID=644536 RepID=A0ACB9SM53_HOLOL|nr:fatty-acid amide hydrolase [Holotrichia oblita]
MTILYRTLLILRTIYDFIVDTFFKVYYGSAKNRLPPIENEIVLESASSLASKIKTRNLKAEDVVGAFIERIKQVNPLINAIVDERFIEALKEARRIDEDISSGKITQEDFRRKPFLGIPFTAKESTSSKGLKWTLGLVVRRNIVAEQDAAVIRLMKEAGAIQIGVTNVPQLNFWGETYNPVYGTTRNPYDLTRNAGGSSGGEASLIAACGSPFGIGTDLGGSIRIPSHRCGIFGHKPSPNLTSSKGLSFSKGDVPILAVAGPLAKRAEDLLPMFKVLVGENISKMKLDEPVDICNLNVFYMTSIKCLRNVKITERMQNNVLKVANYFHTISKRAPIKVDFEDMQYAMELWSYKIQMEKSDFKHNLTNRQGRVNVAIEYLKYLIGRSEYTGYTLFNMMNGLLPTVDFDWAKETLHKLREDLLAKLGDNGILIFPSEPRPATHNYSTLFQYGLSYFCLWNALEMPVTQIPLGLNEEGLPCGVQIVTAPYQDHLSIAVAVELERIFGGYVKVGQA